MTNKLEIAFRSGFEKEAKSYLPTAAAGLAGLTAGGSAGYAIGESVGEENARKSLPQVVRAADEVVSLSKLDDSEIQSMGMNPKSVREDAAQLRQLMGVNG